MAAGICIGAGAIGSGPPIVVLEVIHNSDVIVGMINSGRVGDETCSIAARGAIEHFDRHFHQIFATQGRYVEGAVLLSVAVELRFLQEWQQLKNPTATFETIGRGDIPSRVVRRHIATGGGEEFFGGQMAANRQADLFEIICAIESAGPIRRRLNGRQQQRNQDADDRYDDQ